MKKELINFNEDKQLNNDTTINRKILYECAKSEYLRECDREKIIENKAQIFIGIIITFIALIVQKIPFEKISSLFSLNNNWINYSIILTILVIIIPIFIVLYELVSIINIKQHLRFAIKELKNEKLFEINENRLYGELIWHYYKILEKEEQQNEELANKLKNGIIATICIVCGLVVLIIVVNIMFGGKMNVL